MLRMYPSDPLFADWSRLLTEYAALLNVHCFWNVRDVDTETAEYRAAVVEWKDHVRKLFEELSR